MIKRLLGRGLSRTLIPYISYQKIVTIRQTQKWSAQETIHNERTEVHAQVTRKKERTKSKLSSPSNQNSQECQMYLKLGIPIWSSLTKALTVAGADLPVYLFGSTFSFPKDASKSAALWPSLRICVILQVRPLSAILIFVMVSLVPAGPS